MMKIVVAVNSEKLLFSSNWENMITGMKMDFLKGNEEKWSFSFCLDHNLLDW